MRRLVLPALAIGIIAVTMAWVFQGSTARAQPATPNITWVASAASVAVTSNFTVTLSGDTGSYAVNTYQFDVWFTSPGLSFVSGSHLSGTFPACGGSYTVTPGSPATVTNACSHALPNEAFVGDIEELTFSCDTPGAKTLHWRRSTTTGRSGPRGSRRTRPLT